jgi:hypothetical protein
MPSIPSPLAGRRAFPAISLKSNAGLGDLTDERNQSVLLRSVVVHVLGFGTGGTEPVFVRSVPIHGLNTDAFDLAGPIQVEIEHYPDEVISKVPELDLWASEPTESEALLSIKKAICDLWEELRDEPDSELGAMPRMWKRILGKKIKARVPA